MGGICGFNYENKLLLKEMCELIRHRGPDYVDYYSDSEVSIGIRKISINDLKIKFHTIHNENEDIHVVCDGEIYNFLELKTLLERRGHRFNNEISSEVIVHAYEEWGENCLNRFRGVFAFCIYDSRKKLLFLARDHIGIKPLYYYFDAQRFIFASEIKSLFCHDIKRHLNLKAFSLYLCFRYVPLDLTLFKGIFKVPASNYLRFDLKGKKIIIKRYWDLNFDINWEKTEDQFAKELKDLIIESVKLRLIDGIPIGALLSGGIDSSAIVGVLTKLMEKPVKTYSIGFEKGAPINETKFAKYVAEFNGTDHTELILRSDFSDDLPRIAFYNDDLFADAAIVPVYLIGKHVRKELDVLFTGDGADEVFAGYIPFYSKNYYSKFIPKQALNFFMRFYNNIPSIKLRMLLSYIYDSKTVKGLEDRYIRWILTIPDIEMPKIIPFELESNRFLIKNTFLKNLDIINQFTNWEIKYQLPNQYNIKADRALNGASLIGRIPLLDRDIISWSLTIPSVLKLNGSTRKYILRLATKDFIPPEILNRKKQGFGVPIGLWLKTGLKEISAEILERLEKRSYLLNPHYVKKIKKNRFNISYENRAWIFIMFELWYETFIENDGLKPIKF